jgi:hypothetical protein
MPDPVDGTYPASGDIPPQAQSGMVRPEKAGDKPRPNFSRRQSRGPPKGHDKTVIEAWDFG